MHKFIPTHVNSHVAIARAGFEEHQVAHFQFVAGHGFAFLHQGGGGAGDFHVQLREEGEIDEARTVHALRAEATVLVRHALPVFFLGEQAVEDQGLLGREFQRYFGNVRLGGLPLGGHQAAGCQADE